MAEKDVEYSLDIHREETTDVNTPFEIPAAMLSEVEGIASVINSTYFDGYDGENEDEDNEVSDCSYLQNETIVNVPDEDFEEVAVNSPDPSQILPGYIDLLVSSEYAVNPEQRREDVHFDLRDEILTEETALWPEEIFSNITEDYEEMFTTPVEDMFEDGEIKSSGKQNDEHKPLYHNAPLTVSESLLLIITFAIRHTLSGSALEDLLILVSLHCVTPNLCQKTLHQFRKFFKTLKNPLVYHRYCSYCFLLVDNTINVCPNALCTRDLTKSNSCSFFIEIPIAQQICNLFAKNGFYDNLSYRFNRTKKNNNFEDIYDGSEYKRHCNRGPLDSQHNISLLWNTDGVPVFKSSKYSIWPLYFIINELPFAERTKRENMIFAGLWFGDTKPFMLTFLQPFHSSLRNLETDGVEVEVKCDDRQDNKFISKVLLLAGTCDLPAKCLVCNSMQYNGEYGCSKCKQQGETVKVSARGHVHAFPFLSPNPTGPARTHSETLKNADKAVQNGEHVEGIKGPSWFAGLNSYDIIKGTAIDYMHGLCLGVMKSLISLWFAPENSGKPFNITNKVTRVDERLLQLQPPFEIGRTPRSIENHRKYWKASELRSFLLYYGIPVLFGILDANYFHHFAVFSEASYILLQDSISEGQLQHCQKLLEYFCFMFPYLYELRYQTINIHNLLHLPQSVREIGPIWTHSCFHFEDKNGYILKMIHGTQNISSQLVSAVSFIQNLPQMVESLKNNNEAMAFYKKLNGMQQNAHQTQVMHNAYALGASVTHMLTQNEFIALANELGYNPGTTSVSAFTRLKKDKEIFHSRMYKKVTVRNSYTVLYKSFEEQKPRFGQILFFFQFKPSCTGQGNCMFQCKCHALNYAMIQVLSVVQDINLVTTDYTDLCPLELRHAIPVKKNGIKSHLFFKYQRKMSVSKLQTRA